MSVTPPSQLNVKQRHRQASNIQLTILVLSVSVAKRHDHIKLTRASPPMSALKEHEDVIADIISIDQCTNNQHPL